MGDTVAAGQVVARIDAQAAMQANAASDAQVQSARASADLASKEFERQKQLYPEGLHQSGGTAARRGAVQIRTGAGRGTDRAGWCHAHAIRFLFWLRRPYAGVVSEVPVALGDMAMPGKPLLTVYDPGGDARERQPYRSQLLPAACSAMSSIRVQLPDLGASREWVTPTRVHRAAHQRRQHAHRAIAP